MSRARILAGNWKMNWGPAEALEYFHQIKGRLETHPLENGMRRVVFPAAYALGHDIQQAARESSIELGAQNVHWDEKGAFTGELSALTLKSMGIEWVLVGHSERRQYFGETDESAARRFQRAANTGLNVIYCIGERFEQREAGETEQVLANQLAPFLDVLKALPQQSPLLWALAYEPVWAIGTGKTATAEQAEAAHRYIRKVVWETLGMDAAQKISILYGGSVTPDNAQSLMTQPNVDGVLVGGASLKPDSFARILATR